jgi:ferredoxin-NADP reductase
MLRLSIHDAAPMTPRAYTVNLALEGQPFVYRAGQAAYLQPLGAAKPRPYSIASAPEETMRNGFLRFLMQTGTDGVSGVSPDLLRPGIEVSVDGPLGSFTFPEHPRERNYVFIAGGTGIAPLRSMLWHALLAERPGRIGLIYSVRAPEEFAFLAEFEQLGAEGRIDFRHTVTRTASESWTGRQGRIDLSCLTDMIVPGDTLCFLCGPAGLVGEIPPQLMSLGVTADQILMEQWA